MWFLGMEPLRNIKGVEGTLHRPPPSPGALPHTMRGLPARGGGGRCAGNGPGGPVSPHPKAKRWAAPTVSLETLGKHQPWGWCRGGRMLPPIF